MSDYRDSAGYPVKQPVDQPSDTQAIAARLTEIGERLDYAKRDRLHRYGADGTPERMHQDLTFTIAQLQQSRQEQERLTAEVARWKDATASARPLVEQAEQQRDAAHAALKDALSNVPESRSHQKRFIDVDEAAGSTYEMVPLPWFVEAQAVLDAALAASAPQKEPRDEPKCTYCGTTQADHPYDGQFGYCDTFMPIGWAGGRHPPAPAQETERYLPGDKPGEFLTGEQLINRLKETERGR